MFGEPCYTSFSSKHSGEAGTKQCSRVQWGDNSRDLCSHKGRSAMTQTDVRSSNDHKEDAPDYHKENNLQEMDMLGESVQVERADMLRKVTGGNQE